MSETPKQTRRAPLAGMLGLGAVAGLLGGAMLLMALATDRPAGPKVVYVTATTGPQAATVGADPSALSATPAPPTARPTATLTARPSASATETATPTATPTLFFMSIAALRLGSYPGSDLVIEKELEAGPNYHRYYASYLSEGLKIYALLTIPFGDPPANGWPVIIFNHGYIPPEVYRTTERYVNYVGRLAEAGYIVLRADYRGHGNSEGAAEGAYGDPGYLTDVLNAVASAKRLPQADPDHIGMWGHSMGGYLTLRAMVISRDIRAGVIWGGVVAPYPDLFARGNVDRTPTPRPNGTAEPDRRGWRQWLEAFGTREENPGFWDSLSANSYLTDLSGPLQLHHGTADKDVPLAASEMLYAEMQAAGRPVEFYTYQDDNHNLSDFFTTAMNRTIAFFDQYLRPPG
ncbi:MAG: S9 family peptidase [Anaerolineales bacterium]|nr:S9 family peptidase [Anaerolineales bacterium]